MDKIVCEVLQYPAPMVVVTGGEPLLHKLDELCNLLKYNNLQLHLETSGTQPLSGKWDWICLSPKVQQPPLQAVCSLANECKVVIAGSNDFAWAEQNAARVSPHCRLLLQPEWSRRDEVLPLITEYAKQHPKWRVALQLHKLIDIP
ncbi:hypothetical protein FACS1894156_0970 [Bacteroidia bacterium]|nr:hypothetical protein FACS1894156_0970 [Bacteroidia bacterium]